MSIAKSGASDLALPGMIEIEPTDACNLRCTMCHVSYMAHEKKALLDPQILKKLAPVRNAYFSIGSGFEPMLHPQFDRILKTLSDMDIRMQIITNGTYCDEKNIRTLLDANLFQVNFSFDGIRTQTYERIRRRASFDKTVTNILNARRAFQGRDTYFAINNTIMRSNLDETIEAIDFWDSHDFDIIRLLVMVIRYPVERLLRESLYPERAKARDTFDAAARHVIENKKKIAIWRMFHAGSSATRQYPRNCIGNWVKSDNPKARYVDNYRETYLYDRYHAAKNYRCLAPLNTVTVLSTGDVQMCYKYTVGNLYQSSFEDIWYGEKADQVRALLAATSHDCDTCDCYRFSIGIEEMDADLAENHFNADLLPYLHSVDFDKGTIAVRTSNKPPRLISSLEGYNVVEYGGMYFGVPHLVGPLEIDKTDMTAIPGVVIEKTYGRVIRKIKSARA